MLNYLLDITLGSKYIGDIYINLHYLKNMVTEHISNHWPHEKQIKLFSEEQLKGAAGTLSELKKELSGQPILVVHADNLSDFVLDDFITAHEKRPTGCLLTMMLFKTDAPSTCGIVELDELGRVIKMHEKVSNSPSNLANGAVYIFEPEVLGWIIKNNGTDISAEVIPSFNWKIASWLNQGYHRDIGNPKSYVLAQEEFIKR